MGLSRDRCRLECTTKIDVAAALRQANLVASTCLYQLSIGKRHFKYAPSTYRLCVTSSQATKLFGTTEKPKALGCGVFACVYPHADPDKVVKITRDESDVAGLIKGQGAQVPTLHAAHKLRTHVRWTNPRRRTERYQEWPDQPEAFALVLERLRPFTGAEKSLWQRRIGRMQEFVRADARKREAGAGHAPTAPGKAWATPYIRPTLRDMAEAVCPRRPKAEAASCSLRIRELNKIFVDLTARGVDWSDMHAGNIGVDKHDRWKALDVGAATTPLETDLPEMAGARRRKRRRARR